ncbi:RNI-like protein, partial [Microstroma glucosiphilum]
PVRKRKKLPGGSDSPKSILKPAPPPQKAFSFRRDILQSLNTRLAQQGVNVQVPLPQSGTAQGAANLIGGVFKRLGGIAGAALAGPTGDWPNNDQSGAQGSTEGQVQQHTSPAAASLQSVAARAQQASPTASRNGDAARSLAATDGSTSSTSSTISASSGLPVPSSSAEPLKRVQFTVSKMSVIYPISGAIAPGDEDETRKRIEHLHRQTMKERKGRAWTPNELEALYRQCCKIREEFPLKKMRLVFEEAAQQTPPSLKTLDLSFLPLDRQAIDPLADFLSVDFGLEKLLLENCGLSDDGVKALLHGLLISGTLPNLSLASNRKIKYQGWRYVSIFMRRARALRYLDLSENPINRASLEHIAEAIRKPEEAVTKQPKVKGDGGASEAVEADAASALDMPDDLDEDGEPLMPPAALLRHSADEDKAPLTSAIISLRLENCGLKGPPLNVLGQAVRTSDVKHLSLRRNRINQMGAVALAIMLKDYPESSSTVEEQHASGLRNGSSEAEARSERVSRLSGSSSSVAHRSYSPSPSDGPSITSSPAGGMTARRMPVARDTIDIDQQLTRSEEETIRMTKDPALTEAEAIALYQAKRAKKILAGLPRVGNLLTLDLKSNDIRGGVTYLAQVLRKNRTLRVLNLSDNGIEMGGLVALAEALKYNSTLETLDLSHNPCSGPGLEGITTLRTAFALNSNLKRLFLNDTDLSSEGAIALAEFLPEAKSLIHLDLTENFDIDVAGVMALAVSVKLNKSLRCLDLNIPPNDADFARLSQEILQSCIRNTQAAQKKATLKGLKQPIAAPIYKSVVARAAKEKDERQKAMSATKATEQGSTAEYSKLVEAAQECKNVLQDLLRGEEKRRKEAMPDQVSTEPPSKVFVDDLVAQAQKLRTKLSKAAGGMEEGELLAQTLQVNDELQEVASRLIVFYREAASARSPKLPGSRREAASGSMSAEEAGFSSFSIGDGDDDVEAEHEPHPLTSSLAGLSLDGSTPAGPGLVAEKEEEVGEQDDSLDNPEEIKARNMVDEEGEIFRRARSLGVGDEEDEEEDEEEEEGGEQGG